MKNETLYRKTKEIITVDGRKLIEFREQEVVKGTLVNKQDLVYFGEGLIVLEPIMGHNVEPMPWREQLEAKDIVSALNEHDTFHKMYHEKFKEHVTKQILMNVDGHVGMGPAIEFPGGRQ
jgi:hypothetical protein